MVGLRRKEKGGFCLIWLELEGLSKGEGEGETVGFKWEGEEGWKDYCTRRRGNGRNAIGERVRNVLDKL